MAACVCVRAVFQSEAVAFTVVRDEMFFDIFLLILRSWKH